MHPRLLTDEGRTLGEEYVTVKENIESQETPVVAWTAPRSYDAVEIHFNRHPTRFEPRYVQEVEADADGESTFELYHNVQPVNGETDVSDQPYAAVEAVHVETGDTVDVESIDYATNEVTLTGEFNEEDELKLYPIITQGDVKFEVRNTLGQSGGTLTKFAYPVHRFHDVDQLNQSTQITLDGRVSINEGETVEMILDSEVEIAWEDDDYPDKHVSSVRQRAEVLL